MKTILKRLEDWTAEEISLTLGDAPKGKKSGNEYLVWALDLPNKYLKDDNLREEITTIYRERAKSETKKHRKVSSAKSNRVGSKKEGSKKRTPRQGTDRRVNQRSKRGDKK